MSALSIQVPFPVFQDRDGQPLDNGYVWIGTANLYPITNPVVAYFDAALTIVATQPLRTINGYISNAGTPAQVYVDAVNFSILVQDSKGSVVYNFPDGTGISPNASGVAFTGFKGQVGFVSDLADDDGSDWIGFQPAGSGAVACSAQDKMREIVSVKDFGAVGDGVADDYDAFNLANTNGDFQIPPGTYKIGINLTLTSKVSFMPGATLAPDAGVTIVFADGQGEIDVQWFGAKGDGTTDDTTAIQNAINSGYDIYLPPTNAGYKVAGNGTGQRLEIPARRNIYGDFFKTKILHSNDNWLFEIRGSFIGVSRLQIDARDATTSGRGQFLIRSDLDGYQRIWLKEIETDRSFQFLRDSKDGVNLLVNIQLEDVICRRHRGNGIDLEDAFAYCRFTNVTVDYVNSVSKNHNAYRVVNNAGSVWTNVDVTGGQVDATTSSQHGFFFSNCIAVWMNNCMADTVGGYGFYLFSDCRAFYMSQCVSSFNGYVGFYIVGVGNFNNMFVNCTCIGRNTLTFSVASQAGWFVLNNTGTQLTGCKSLENTGAGLYFQNSTGTAVTGCTIASNTTWGIETLGTNGGIYSVNSINQPASSGNASLATSIEHLVSSQLTSGVIGNLTGPGTI
jgi:hypothetical protein